MDGVVSSIPLSELVLALDPLPPDHVVAAARRLRYRDLLVVGLISTEPEPFPDNWIYLHDPGTRAGRVQNFGAWSPGMTRPGYTCLGAEYFCFQGDEIWSLPDHALVELAKRELGKIGLIDPAHVVDGVAIRVPRAYPMYDKGYDEPRWRRSAAPRAHDPGRLTPRRRQRSALLLGEDQLAPELDRELERDVLVDHPERLDARRRRARGTSRRRG